MILFWQVLPWIMSCITIYCMWQAGNKHTHAWSLGLFNQILWLMFNIHYEVWGFLPTTVFLTFVYARNLIKWRNDAQRISEKHPIRQRI